MKFANPGTLCSIALYLVGVLCVFDAYPAAADGTAAPSNSVAGLPPDGYDWQTVCEKYKNVPIPAGDRPTPAMAASLKDCNSRSLYYGVSGPPQPVTARFCAYDEYERNEGPIAGAAMLMTVYANGDGAGRNLPLALKFACTLEGAPAEMEGRIYHLETLLKQHWQGTDFSVCDDITSGYLQGYCADLAESIAKVERGRKYARLQKGWSRGELAAFDALKSVADKFFNTRVDNEVDQMGTARGALMIGEGAALDEGFLLLLQTLEDGTLPRVSKERAVAADAALNAAYRKLQAAKDPAWGTVTRSGIKKTEREWLRYRDAWVKFAREKYPQVDSAAIATWLTLKRSGQLQEFE
jgi:hypothetical protein